MATALIRNSLIKIVRKHDTYAVAYQRAAAHRQLRRSICFSRFALHPGTRGIAAVSARLSTRAYSSLNKPTTSGLVGWYLDVLETRPILTKSITAAIIYAAADTSSQVILGGSSDKYDLMRTLRMACYGLVILGPSLHYWYNLVSRLFPNRDILSTLKKIVLGQASYGPVMTAIFFSINAALQGESCSEIVARLRRDMLTTMINGLVYWPACDFVTFKFIPVHLQPLVVNSFSYLWTIYMTYMASLEKVGAS